MAHDLVIRGGAIVDGTGAEPIHGDVAIDEDKITEIGKVGGKGRQEIEADGHAVMPGFIDLHTHFDAQVGWDPALTPVSWHGVTTALFGNCGVTFAPCKPEDQEFLAGMMETVEDIPKDAILTGLPWNWESYGEYLDAITALNPAINIVGMVGHCAVRFYVMGERSIEEAATEDDIREMTAVVDQSVKDGAIGFSTTRFLLHFLPDGRLVPGTHAEDRELIEIAKIVGKHDGLMQTVINVDAIDSEMDLLAKEARFNNRVLFSTTAGGSFRYGDMVNSKVQAMRAEGLDINGITIPRSGGNVWGLSTGNFFGRDRGRDLDTPEWHRLRMLTFEERMAAIEDPAVRETLVNEVKSNPAAMNTCERIYWLGDGEQPNYTRVRDDNLVSLASAANEHPAETFIRMARESDGRALFHLRSFNVNLESLEKVMKQDWILPGLGDAGAHVSQISDGGWATFALSHWYRDKGIFSLPELVRRLTSAPAKVLGLADRGTLAPGMRADINVVDTDNVHECMPELVHDFPYNASRFIQRAVGYKATVCNGEIILRDDELTGTRSGEVLRH
jgi:N-acyl-D-amino-acid deacylase